MREIELIYVEILNETEHLFIFTTTFNGQNYGQMLTLNMALPIVTQDSEFEKALATLININRKTAKKATDSRTL